MAVDTPFIGIDFGTCNSGMAWFNPRTGRAEVLRNAEGMERMPSRVYFGEPQILAGKPAEDAFDDEGMRPFVFPPGAKRVIGNKEMLWPIPGRDVRESPRPRDVVIEVLRKLREDAEDLHFHAAVSRAVITVPATFNQLETEEIANAAYTAGFHQQVETLTEPEAAALAYQKSTDQLGHSFLVFDLGGGTFDLALLGRGRAADDFFLLQKPSGLRKGGEDFDRALYDFVEKKAKEAGRSLGSDDSYNLEILQLCRVRKENLSVSETVEFSSILPDGRPFRHKLDRRTFEALIEDTVTTIVDMAERMCNAAKDKHPIDTIVPVGGALRVPLVSKMLEERLHIKPYKWDLQDVAVALGAAYHAEKLWGRERRESRTRPNRIRSG